MPIRYYLGTLFLVSSFFLCAMYRPKAFTIMLEPAGDTKHTGREIDDCFERGITLQFAEKLKKTLEAEYPGLRIILSRFPGESLEPLQNANFSNRLAVDFYLSIHFYEETEEKPQLFLYQFVYNRTTDFWHHPVNTLSFIPYELAHQEYANLSKTYGNFMIKTLQDNKYKKYFDAKGLYAIPFKPLIGIKSPAIALEASLKTKNGWSVFIDPVAQSLKPIIEEGMLQ